MLRLIREHEPVRPSLRVSTLSRKRPETSRPEASRPETPRPEGDTLSRRLAGDLDWITLRALEKDRERRYGSVADLAEDIRRYRRHEPVLAGPPSGIYRLRKFVQRNRTVVASGVLLAAVLVASAVAVTWQWRTAVAERERAEAAGEHARQEAARAARINAFLQDMLASADPGEMGKDVTVREVLDQAAASLERGLASDPEAHADAHHTLGVTYVSLGLLQEGRSHLEEALALRRELHGPDHESIAEELRNLGWCLHQLNQEEDARRLTLEGLRMQRRLAPEPDSLIGRLLSQLALIELAQDQYEDAERLGQMSVRQIEQLTPVPERDLGEALLHLTEVYWARRELEAGETMARRALAINERVLGQDHARVLENMNLLAGLIKNNGQAGLDEAEALRRAALKRARRRLGNDHHRVADYANNLAVILMEARGRLDEAREYQLEALRIWQQAFDGPHANILTAMNNLGYIEMCLGRYEQAVDWYRQALETGADKESPHRAFQALGNLGTVRHHQGRYQEAEELRTQFKAQLSKRIVPDAPGWAWVYLDDACLELHLGRLDAAEESLARAREILDRLSGEGKPRKGAESLHRHRLGLLLALGGRWDEAGPLLSASLAELSTWTGGYPARRHEFRFGEQVCRVAGRHELARAHSVALEELEDSLVPADEAPEAGS
jgi:tetratricopeptide (TPR) repeat protein